VWQSLRVPRSEILAKNTLMLSACVRFYGRIVVITISNPKKVGITTFTRTMKDRQE